MQERKPRKRQLWQLCYILLTISILIALGVANPELGALFHGRLPVEGLWLILCGAGMLGFWLLQTGVYALAQRLVGARVGPWRTFRVMMFGEYYSAITPLASGGQPMQLGYYRRYGVPTAKATGVLAVRYIGYVSSICVCYLVALSLRGGSILREHPVVFWLTALGFAVNLFSIVMVALLMVRPELVRKLGARFIALLCRLPALRDKNSKWQAGFENGLVEFAAAAECIRSHPWQCAGLGALSLVSVASQFSIAYFVYRAVGLSEAGYFELFSMQIYLYLAVSFAPTPGATGATEGGFYLFFAMLFPKSLLFSAMLLWRLFTYYANLLLGTALIVGDELHAMRRAKR